MVHWPFRLTEHTDSLRGQQLIVVHTLFDKPHCDMARAREHCVHADPAHTRCWNGSAATSRFDARGYGYSEFLPRDHQVRAWTRL